MSEEKYLTKKMKFISIVLGTLACGFLWRCRGESGFGSSWGMYSVGLVLMLLIYNFYGNRKNMKYEMILIGSLLAGLGVTGYATVLEQTAGILWSDLPYNGELLYGATYENVLMQGESVYAPINPYSGLMIMLVMGFTLVPLFSFFLSSLFSDKKYKISHYLILIGIFFGVSYLCKATIAHPILKAINPDQVEYAAKGLAFGGYDYASPMKAYMAHFGNRKWTQGIPFFENYYMSIEHISDAIAIIAISLYALIGKKDKITCFASLIIDLFTSAATTAFSSLITVGFNTGLLGNVTCPRNLMYGSGWGLWEYATGASVGFITMLVIALLPKKYTKPNEADIEPLIENKTTNFVFNILATTFVLGLVPWRAIGIRLAKLLTYQGIIEDESPTGEIIMITGTVLLAVWFIVRLKKNMLDKNSSPFDVTPFRFSMTAFPAYVVLCCILYFFTNHGYAFTLPYSEMTSLSSFIYIMTGPEWTEFSLMFITFVLIVICYIPARKRLIGKYDLSKFNTQKNVNVHKVN